MNDETGLICAYVLDGQGGGRQAGWSEIAAWNPAQGALWVHLDRSADESQRWLREASGLDPLITDALLAEETRPRSLAIGDGLLVILRGVNLNPGADPEDMISIRMWIDPRRIITTRARRLMAINDLRERLAAGVGPKTTGDFLVQAADRMVGRMGPVIDELNDVVDALEDELVTTESREIRQKLASIRRQAIALRRYLAPQREAMARLQGEGVGWLEAQHRGLLRETTDRVLRCVEDLDAIRERAAVVQDELMNRLSDQMNRTIYVLTVVATIMLPLGFLTGLLGINVGGIPGAENPWGFIAVCLALAALVAAEVWLFRRLKWI
jgi:zinc transporter